MQAREHKALWSSFSDRNLFEIGHSLGCLLREGGLLQPALGRGVLPYAFIDKHDVDRPLSIVQADQRRVCPTKPP